LISKLRSHYLINESIILHFEECYPGQAYGKPISWGAIYAVLALAHRLRAMSPLAASEDTTNARFYLEKCLNQLPTLLLQTPSLPLVQCLLGISILLQTSPQSDPAPLFISTALRLAQSMGYNKTRSLRPEDTQQGEQQRRAFWIAFFMAIECSLQYRHPPTQDYENIDIELPDASPGDGVGDIRADGGTWKVNILYLHVELCLLQAEVIEKLLSVKARSQPEHVLAAAAQVLAGKLQKWATNWLFRLQPADLIKLLHSDVVHVTFLEAAYFQAIYSLQAHVRSGSYKPGATIMVNALTQISQQPAQPCHQEARRLLNVLTILPCGNVACCWYAGTDCR
jgi:Fungal specific transcription factor domain